MKYKKRISIFNNSLKKRIGTILGTLFIVSIIMGIMIFAYYKNNFRSLLNEEVSATLENISSQNVKTIQREIEDKQKLFRYIELGIEKSNHYHIEEILLDLKEISEIYNFDNIGVIDKNGICYTISGETLDLSECDDYKAEIQGISEVMTSYKGQDNTVRLNIFTYPIYNEKDVEVILTAIYKPEDFYEIINMNSFNERGESIIINKKGALVAVPNHENSEEGSLNLLKNIKKENNQLYEKVKNGILKSEKGYIYCKYKEAAYWVYYEPLMIEDWYLISSIPQSSLYENADEILRSIDFSMIFIPLVLISLLSIFAFGYIKYQKKISNMVLTDELTKEKNLQYLKMDFENMPFFERKDKSLIVLDIDKFKTINMMYGFNVGDELLKYIPKVFKEELPEDKIYKDRADIFIAIISHRNKDELLNKIYAFTMRIKKDIESQLIVPVSISMGICSIDNSYDLNEIYNNALIAKKTVKGKADSFFSFFDEASRKQMIRNTQIEAKFFSALQNQEFEVWYQPKYDMRTGKIHGAEALIRWRNHDGSLLLPGKFIPVFEDNGQIIQLDKEVIKLVCKDMREISLLGYELAPVSINLSRLHFKSSGIVDTIKESIEAYDIDPSKLSFEITESAFIDDKKVIDHIISKLHEIGVTVEMDDYGIGISTISSLLSSKFDTLKLDKSFIDGIGNEKIDIVIRSTISMAQKLNMQVTAEGIESKEQVDFLMANGCYLGQGFYFSKPLQKNAYIALLSAE